MANNRFYFGLFLTLVVGFSYASFAAELSQQNLSQGRNEGQLLVQNTKKSQHHRHARWIRKNLERIPGGKYLEKLSFNYAPTEGYSRNVRLDSDHKRTFYTEQYFSVGYLDHIKKSVFYRVSYNLHHINYYKFANANVLDQDLRAESSIKLRDKLFLEPEYNFDIFRRPYNAQASFNKNGVKVGLKHFLIKKKFYHKPSYVFGHRGYTKARARLVGEDGLPGDNGRKDNLNGFDYEIGYHPYSGLLIRVHNQVGRNESNDQYFDFYDYNYYQVTPLVTWAPHKKILLSSGFQFQRNNYDERDLHDRAEAEDISTLFGSVFYQFHNNASLGFHWFYVHNDSNLPELEYDNATFSAGLHFHF